MAKGKDKQGNTLARILKAYSSGDLDDKLKPVEKKPGKQAHPRGTKRARDGSPVEETHAITKPKEPRGVEAGLKERQEKRIKSENTKSTPNPKPFGKGAQKGQKPNPLLEARKALPIWPHAQSIRAALKKNNVLVLTGETGSGKSTQVPQFLLSEPWCQKCIAVTQPRRMAAISLARRVAQEMSCPPPGRVPGAKVGYSVRFDNATGPHTRVKFLTEGMLLQEMVRDREMEEYSAIIVDEVHERSVNVDLILGFLKNLLSDLENGRLKKRKNPLKVVVMSATVDVGALVQFFGEGSKESEDTQQTLHSDVSSTLVGTQQNQDISTCYIEGRQYPVQTIYLPEPTQNWVESALIHIFQIHRKEPLPGDILVFLTGREKIEKLEKLVNEYAEGLEDSLPKLLVLPLFSALPQHAQQRIFMPTPHRTRKVILATNVAETSVTVPGVRYVIDCGKSKIKEYRNALGLESLLAKPISKSAADQRKGRAGREAPGKCYRLYTEDGYNGFADRTQPEILRCDLSHALLTMVAAGIGLRDVFSFPFLDPPPRGAIERAVALLHDIGAVTEEAEIANDALTMAKFPLTPALSRVLIEAATPERNCLEDVVDIVSALSTEDIFLNLANEERKKEDAEAARRGFYRRSGDHMTLLAAVQGYLEETSDRKAWCAKHFISHRAMQNVVKVRKQLLELCQRLSLVPNSSSSVDPPTANASPEEHTKRVLQCFARGFMRNIARLMPDGSYQTLVSKQTVAIHPSSVLYGRKTDYLLFTEFVFTNRAWVKGVSAPDVGALEEVMRKVVLGDGDGE
ncbi:DEAH-box RNA helicase [Westerdykella ornata]|uniref:RNA helicase n=1 Tax=Westerdykella ornata TaxID=318751 RepID=A0A6A6JTI1_WESOR|nr:DEAH-box RNA helicase [Westerdykella ornata]KAF2278309.1 DEAH-box RNA helicase [Westerdykella ornata]